MPDPSAVAVPLWYRVDREGRISAVSEDWDRVADGYGAPGARSSVVVGRRLTEFLVGDSARMFVAAALQSVRLLERPLTLPYRCDGPEERRSYEMNLSPLAEGGVEVQHRLISREPRTTVRVDPRGGWRCSQCLRVRYRGASLWVEADFSPTILAVDVCPACAARLFAQPDGPPNGEDDDGP